MALEVVLAVETVACVELVRAMVVVAAPGSVDVEAAFSRGVVVAFISIKLLVVETRVLVGAKNASVVVVLVAMRVLVDENATVLVGAGVRPSVVEVVVSSCTGVEVVCSLVCCTSTICVEDAEL